MSHNIRSAIDFAIRQEQRSAELYQSLADQAQDDETRAYFLRFAEEEHKHRTLLERLGDDGIRPEAKDDDGQVEVHVPAAVDFSPDMSRKEILAIAIQREAAAQRLYTNLAALARDDKLRMTLQALTDEEGKHEQLLKGLF